MKRIITSLLINLTAAIVAAAVTPFLVVCYFRGPLADHDAYMQTEYPGSPLRIGLRTDEEIDLLEGYITG